MLIINFISLIYTTAYFQVYSKYDEVMDEYNVVILVHDIFSKFTIIRVIDTRKIDDNITFFKRLDDINLIKQEIDFVKGNLSFNYFDKAYTTYFFYKLKLSDVENGNIKIMIELDRKFINAKINLFNNLRYKFNTDIAFDCANLNDKICGELDSKEYSKSYYNNFIFKARLDMELDDYMILYEHIIEIDKQLLEWDAIMSDNEGFIDKCFCTEKKNIYSNSKDYENIRESSILDYNKYIELIRKYRLLSNICEEHEKKINEYLSFKNIDLQSVVDIDGIFKSSVESRKDLTRDSQENNSNEISKPKQMLNGELIKEFKIAEQALNDRLEEDYKKAYISALNMILDENKKLNNMTKSVHSKEYEKDKKLEEDEKNYN